MSEISDLTIDGLISLEDGLGAVMTWNGEDYPVVPTSAVRGKDLGAGGFKLRSDVSLIVRNAMLPDPGPQPKQKITYLGDEYRIDTLEKTPGEPFIRLECNDPNQ